MTKSKNKVLILGSAPTALRARDWARTPFTHIVAINNAWRVRADWDFLIHPEDFPTKNMPTSVSDIQRIVTANEYVPIQNGFGGFVYAGGTMAFTAGYWALSALQPSVLAYCGCDMIYSGQGRTHFYGNGAADPLRSDVTLRLLEAKSARLGLFAAAQGCRTVRLFEGPSRLVYPSVDGEDLSSVEMPSTSGMAEIIRSESDLGYFVESGRYWEVETEFDPQKIDAIDQRWLSLYPSATQL